MKKQALEPKVTNYRKNGEVFDPRGFLVPRKGFETVYAIIARAESEVNRK